ncbi:MAG TPA: alginate export family protein [Gammaproteobacteria bacterium]
MAEPASRDEASPRRGLSWSGLHRARYARLWNQYRPGLRGDDQVLELRTALRATYDAGRVTLVGDVQDARAYLTDEQSGVSSAIVNTLEIVQAYAAIGRADGEHGTRVQAGRFLLELGSGRLIAAEQYRNVARSFLGVLAETVSPTRGRLLAFAALPTVTLPDDRHALLANDHASDDADADLAMLGALWDVPWTGASLDAELYVYALDEHDDPTERETPDRRLTTAGLRIERRTAPGRWDFEVELIRQTGSRHASAEPSDERALDVDARFAHLEVGFAFIGRASPRLSGEYEYGSGDSDPTDDRWERFDALYGHRRVDLAPTGIYTALGRENIATLGVRASWAFGDRADAFVAYRTVRLAEAADAFASTGVRDPTGRSGRDAGVQLDVRYRRWLRPGALRVEVGATFLGNGPFLRAAPNATRQGDPTYFYTDLTYTFGAR